MNFQFDAVMFLALFTLGAALVFGVVSWLRAQRAQDHHEDAAVAQRQRMDEADAPLERVPGQGGTESGEETAVPVAPSDSGRSWSEERGRNPPTPSPTPMPPRN